MTEDEAKTKWCPFANVVSVGKAAIQSSGNRLADSKSDNLNPLAARCIGAEFMAWRTTKDPIPGIQRIEKIKRYRSMTGFGLVEAKRAIEEQYPLETCYCGLAGKP